MAGVHRREARGAGDGAVMSTPPLLILKKGSATKADIEMVRKAGIAVLVVMNPDDVRYMDPPLERTTRIQALCFAMVQKLLNEGGTINRDDVRRKVTAMVMADAQPAQASPVQS